MSDGDPISYMALAAGTPVRSADGAEVGRVKSVLADEREDIFDGVVITTPHGDRFVDAPEVDAIFEHALVLEIDAAEAARLPPPTRNPGVLRATPDDAAPRLLAAVHGGVPPPLTAATGVSGASPRTTAAALRAASTAIAVRVSVVAEPRWGVSTTFSRPAGRARRRARARTRPAPRRR